MPKYGFICVLMALLGSQGIVVKIQPPSFFCTVDYNLGYMLMVSTGYSCYIYPRKMYRVFLQEIICQKTQRQVSLLNSNRKTFITRACHQIQVFWKLTSALKLFLSCSAASKASERSFFSCKKKIVFPYRNEFKVNMYVHRPYAKMAAVNFCHREEVHVFVNRNKLLHCKDQVKRNHCMKF